MKVAIDTSNENEKISGFGIVGDSLFIKEGSMDMKVALSDITGGSGSAYSVGMMYDELGGWVIGLTPDGKHGLIAAKIDQSNSSDWYNAQNVCSDPGNHDVVGKNFVDWRLPTAYELNLMWENLADSDGNDENTGLSDPNNLGGFALGNYWSSAEYDNSIARRQYFVIGNQSNSFKDFSNNVRCIRAF
jgi:hypothetical protein